MKQKNIKTHRILAIILLLGLGLIGSSSVASNVKAQSTSGDYTVLAPLPCIEGGGITCTTGGNGAVQPTVNFKTYVQYTINLLIGLSAVVAVVMIVWGGVEYMYTASFSGKKMGLEKVTHAIYGLVLVLTSYIILRTIDPRLVEIPNTIVPTIEIRDVLMEDASSLLTNKIMSDANRAVIKNVELSKEIENIRAERNVVVAKRAEVVNQMDGLDIEDPDFDTKMSKLEADKRKLDAKNNELEISKQLKTAQIYFNGIVMKAKAESVDSEANGTAMTLQQRIAKTNEAKALIPKTLEEFRNKMVDLGQSDLSALNNSAKYATALLDLHNLEFVTSSATIKYASGGMGVGGAGYKTSYVLATPDAKDKEFNSKSDAVKYLQSEIAKIEVVKNGLTDSEQKTDLQQRIEGLQNTIKNNKTLN